MGLAALEYRWAHNGEFPVALDALNMNSNDLANPFSERYATMQSRRAPDGTYWVWLKWHGDEDDGRTPPDETGDRWAFRNWRSDNLSFRIPSIDLQLKVEK